MRWWEETAPSDQSTLANCLSSRTVSQKHRGGSGGKLGDRDGGGVKLGHRGGRGGKLGHRGGGGKQGLQQRACYAVYGCHASDDL